MFFLLRPEFDISGFWATYIPWSILFFLFPRGYIVLDDNETELHDEYWED